MSVTVKLKHLRIAPRKVRLVADLIRGKTVEAADQQLDFTIKKAVQPLQKLLKSAIASAEHNFQLDKSNLYISKIIVDEGPTLKRGRARAKGVISPIKKRSSHITLVLDEVEPKLKETKIRKETKVPKAAEEMKEKTRIEEIEKVTEGKKPKRPRPRFKMPKPKVRQRVQKMFRRKAF